jgi:hypothetical protein
MKHINNYDNYKNLIKEAVSVRTDRYKRSHGKEPRGNGLWAFYFDDKEGDPIFTPGAMNYSDAIKWAKEEAKKAGKSVIYVGESVNEAARVGKSSWKSVLSDLEDEGWDVSGNTATQEVDSEKDPEGYVTVELTSKGGDYVKYTLKSSKGKVIDTDEIDAEGLSAGELNNEIWHYIKESVNEASTVKDEVISRLSDFFRVSPNALKKFNFDGKDNIKELTKALNSTSDQGTEMYYKVAIDLAKKDLGESVSEGQELIFDIVEPEFNDLKGKLDNLNKKTVDLKWRKALDQIQREVEKLEFFISKYDRQLGAIETNESVNEAWFGPFQFNDKMSDEELKTMYNDAVNGYAYWKKGLQYPKSDYKKAYQEIEKILKKRGVKVDESAINEKEYSDEERKALADKGLALPDGSFPIKNLDDLKNAIQAYGRSKDQSATAKFIVKRAKALSAEDLIPDTADFQKALKETLTEGNAFLAARAKAIEEDLEEFEFNGKKYPVLNRPKMVKEELDHKDAMAIINAAGQFTSTADEAADQMWKDKEDLVDYLLSDHIPKKYHSQFLKSIK